MAEMINLRRIRKARLRAAETVKSAENRVKFGRTDAQRDEEMRNKLLSARRLDGYHIESTSRETPDVKS